MTNGDRLTAVTGGLSCCAVLGGETCHVFLYLPSTTSGLVVFAVVSHCKWLGTQVCVCVCVCVFLCKKRSGKYLRRCDTHLIPSALYCPPSFCLHPPSLSLFLPSLPLSSPPAPYPPLPPPSLGESEGSAVTVYQVTPSCCRLRVYKEEGRGIQ